ncbi:ribosome recycling factor [soil metagenome]
MVNNPLTTDHFKESEAKMGSALTALEQHFGTLRTGRASTSMLDKITIDAYGTPMPLAQVASVSTPDARSIVIAPWDKSQLAAIEKAILAANLGVTPQNDGKQVRLSLPPLTEDRRNELVKKAHSMAEDARIAIRNVRKHTKEVFDKMKKDKKLTEDQLHDSNEDLQKTTDKWIVKVDEHLKKKEKEVMDV